STPHKERSRTALRTWLAASGALVDAAEYSSSDVSHTFWHRAGGFSARLDRWYCSRRAAQDSSVSVATYRPVDHAGVVLRYRHEAVKRGRDRWMLNTSVLADQELKERISVKLERLLRRNNNHAAVVDDDIVDYVAMSAHERWEHFVSSATSICKERS